MSRLCRLKTKSHGEEGQWAYEEIVKLRKERDELLEALKRAETAMEVCSDWITEIEMDDGWTTTADEKLKISAAIASVKDGAA